MTYITNDCLAVFIYKKLDQEYTSPLIGSLFENDAQYLKFCQNFDYYMQITPVFGLPKLPVKFLGVKNPPCMFLEDIEIHWPHETDPHTVLEKWNRRKQRISEPKFLWSDEQMFEGYEELLKTEFPGEFVFVKDIEGYVPKSLDYNKLADYWLGKTTEEVHF